MNMMLKKIMMLKMILMIVPHVVEAGRALVPMVLVVVGFQLLMQENGQPLKAMLPNNCDYNSR